MQWLLDNPGLGRPMTLVVASPAFPPAGEMPQRYTCYGEDRSPPVVIGGPHAATESFALLMWSEANGRPWVHWAAWDLPEQQVELPEQASLSLYGGVLGQNSWGRAQYDGPFPDAGTHDVALVVYALDTFVGLPRGATVEQLLPLLEQHAVAWGVATTQFTAPSKGQTARAPSA